jgi:uncharacterized OB-fold protein
MALDHRPLPGDFAPDNADQEFWDACRDGVFLIQQCAVCERRYWPAGSCITHGADAMSWVPASGRGRLHTWTVIHQEYPNSFEDGPATNVAVVELAEGPFFHSKVVDCANTDLSVGLSLKVVFREVAPGLTLPLFAPAIE